MQSEQNQRNRQKAAGYSGVGSAALNAPDNLCQRVFGRCRSTSGERLHASYEGDARLPARTIEPFSVWRARANVLRDSARGSLSACGDHGVAGPPTKTMRPSVKLRGQLDVLAANLRAAGAA